MDSDETAIYALPTNRGASRVSPAVGIPLGDVAEVTEDGKLRPKFHQGQRLAYWSTARITLVLAGTQGGKTTIGPWWMLKQIKERGPGDYIVAGPELTLLRKKVIPEFCRLFDDILHLGTFVGSPDMKFVISPAGERAIFGAEQAERTTVWFGHGSDPDSLESMTAKAAWEDEPGQKKFRLDSHQAIERRLAIEDGPILQTTTPYDLGWLKTEIYDRRNDPDADILVINFPSIANPKFSRKVWERAKASLPAWKFNMFYRGRFERPAGMIYGCWSDDPGGNIIPPFDIPQTWPRWVGLDFGGVNTAALKFAQELDAKGSKTGRFIGYAEYHAGGRTAEEHAHALVKDEPRKPTAVGGSKSEGQWRREFARGGLAVHPPPISDVEIGIDRTYGMIKSRNLIVFDTLKKFLDQVHSYGRVLDENGEPTEAIEDKESYHLLDATRYFCAMVARERSNAEVW